MKAIGGILAAGAFLVMLAIALLCHFDGREI